MRVHPWLLSLLIPDRTSPYWSGRCPIVHWTVKVDFEFPTDGMIRILGKQPMTIMGRGGWQKTGRRSLAAVFLVATGLCACAQGPATVVPVPHEDRDGWMEMHNRFVVDAKKGHIDLLFLGDSITEYWNHNEVWQRFYGPRQAANFGIGGDRTEHVLWRIQHGELDGIQPKVAILMIGTNNVSSSTPDEIAQGVTAIINELRSHIPETKILLLGVFPRGEKPSSVRERLKSVNQEIAKLADGSHVKFLDISQAFLNPDGTISSNIMPDYLHLSRKGYRIWAESMEPTLWSLLDEPG
jgi:lysophospholipase L1-like esterase